MERYESYNSSGVEWLGEIPSHWRVKKSKFLWREKEDRSLLGDEELLSVSQYYGVVPRAEDSRSESLENYKRCEPNDLVINIMLAWMNGLGVSKYSGIVSPAYCVYSQLEDHNPRYFDYLYRTPLYLAEFARRSKGIVPSRWRMYTADFGQVLSLLPPRVEQDRIVAFLDQKTAEIDAAIAKKTRLIEFLNEHKKTFVESLVCRGLGSASPIRNSGVDSVGNIPEHWHVKKLGHLSNVVRGASPRPAGDPRYFSSNEGVSWVTVAEVTKDEMLYLRETKEFLTPTGAHQSQVFHRGTMIFTNSGATLGVPKILDIDCCANDGIVALKQLSGEVNKEFLYYFLSTTTERLREEMKQGGGQPNLNTGIVKSIAVPQPPVQEQLQIVKCINLYLGQQQTILRQTRVSIKQLQKLKETLIAEVVVGKLRV